MKIVVSNLLICLVSFQAAAEELTPEQLDRTFNRVIHYPTELQSFLIAHPEARYLKEGRAVLASKILEPAGKLVRGGRTCLARIDEKAREYIEPLSSSKKYADYDFSIPENYFAEHSRIEFTPQSMDPAEANLEHMVAVDLIAKRNGKCSLMFRWHLGGGVGDECRCEPVDPEFVYESRLANKVLTRYSQLMGANAACAASGTDYQSDIVAYLDHWIAGYNKWLKAILDKEAEGGVVYPSEKGEAEDVAFALPQVSEKTLKQVAYDAAKRNISGLPPQQLTEYCAGRLPERIKQANAEVLFATNRLR